MVQWKAIEHADWQVTLCTITAESDAAPADDAPPTSTARLELLGATITLHQDGTVLVANAAGQSGTKVHVPCPVCSAKFYIEA